MSHLVCPHCQLVVHHNIEVSRGLTRRGHAALNAIAGLIVQTGRSPSYEEIGEAMGLGRKSKGRVAAYVGQLEGRGFLRRSPLLARSLDLTPAGWGLFGKVGSADAG